MQILGRDIFLEDEGTSLQNVIVIIPGWRSPTDCCQPWSCGVCVDGIGYEMSCGLVGECVHDLYSPLCHAIMPGK